MLGERGMKMRNFSLEGQYLETSWIVKAGDGNAMFMDLGGRRPQRLLLSYSVQRILPPGRMAPSMGRVEKQGT